jgi:hypothetical protein
MARLVERPAETEADDRAELDRRLRNACRPKPVDGEVNDVWALAVRTERDRLEEDGLTGIELLEALEQFGRTWMKRPEWKKLLREAADRICDDGRSFVALDDSIRTR